MPSKRAGSRAPKARRWGSGRRDASRRPATPRIGTSRVVAPRVSIESQPWALLVPHLEPLGIDVERTIGQIKRYASAVLEWNRGVSNLISRNDESRLVGRHLVESVQPATWLKSSGAMRWLDFGSGAGLPAIPLRLAGVGEEWTLVESRRNKTLFIRKILLYNKIDRVSVVCQRLEMLVGDPLMASGFDGFTARATLRLAETLDLARHFVRQGGFAFLWKGSGLDQEMRSSTEWREHWEESGRIEVGSGPISVIRYIRK